MLHLTRLWFAATFLLVSVTASLAAPAVTLSAGIGPPTSSLKVTATGLSSYSAVDVFFDTTAMCVALTNGTGTGSCTLKVPADAQPVTHWISAIQRYSGKGAQKSFIVRTDWAQIHGNNALHAGYNRFENTLSSFNVDSLNLLWKAWLGVQGTMSTPVVASGRVYITSLDGRLFAFNARTGATIAGFPKTMGGQVLYGSPAVSANRVYAATSTANHRKLLAFNATTGASISGFPKILTHDAYGSPTVDGNKVFVTTIDGKIHGFNATTGVKLTGYPITVSAASVTSAVTAYSGRLYFTSSDGKLYAFNENTGAPLIGLSYPVIAGAAIDGSAAVSTGLIVFGAMDNKLYVRDERSGSGLPGFPFLATGKIEGTPAIAGGRIYIAESDGNVQCVDIAKATACWSKSLDAGSFSSPVVAGGVVYVLSQTRLYGLSASNGAILWSTTNYTSPAFNSASVANGILYAAAAPNGIVAYSLNGVAPSAKLPGGELGVKPALSALKPNLALTPERN